MAGDQGAAMPAPAKVVSTSLGVLRRAGYTDQQALILLDDICDTVMARLGFEPGGPYAWVEEVQIIVQHRLGRMGGE
jgi:hypothetical protein